MIRAFESVNRQIIYSAVAFWIDDVLKRSDHGELFRKALQHGLYPFIFMTKDEDHHPLAGSSVAERYIAQQPFLLHNIKELEVVINAILLYPQAHSIRRIGL